MRRLALIQSGIVVNVVEAPDGWAAGDQFEMRQLPDDSPVGPGYTFDGTAYQPPVPPQPTALPPREFLALFTSAELDAIEDSTHSIARAGKRLLYTLTSEVRLAAPELSQLLQGLQAIGILTADRVTRILSGQGPA